jgi:hypothetical protein
MQAIIAVFDNGILTVCTVRNSWASRADFKMIDHLVHRWWHLVIIFRPDRSSGASRSASFEDNAHITDHDRFL